MKHGKRMIAVGIVLVVLLAAMIYVETYYHAAPEAIAALSSSDQIQVSKTEDGWFFDGPSETAALIFYPGGKVEETAYAPFLKRLAEKGMDVFLVRMPLRLAIFDMDAADRIRRGHSYSSWVIGGHSLGGVIASEYAGKHADDLDGLILLASYSIRSLPESLNTIVIYGSEDRILNQRSYAANHSHLPENTKEFVIEGGNHAQFGCYGTQMGDGTPKITGDEQIQKTTDLIIQSVFLNKK